MRQQVSLVVCQSSTPGAADVLDVFFGKVGSVLFGAGVAAAVGHLLLPWSTAAWASETLSATLAAAVKVLAELQEDVYEDSQRAWRQQQQQQPEENAAAAAGATACTSRGHSIGDLQALLVVPLVAVRSSLAMESPMWQTVPQVWGAAAACARAACGCVLARPTTYAH